MLTAQLSKPIFYRDMDGPAGSSVLSFILSSGECIFITDGAIIRVAALFGHLKYFFHIYSFFVVDFRTSRFRIKKENLVIFLYPYFNLKVAAVLLKSATMVAVVEV
jgi:hypothetical protein